MLDIGLDIGRAIFSQPAGALTMGRRLALPLFFRSKLPPPVRSTWEHLQENGHGAWLAGEGVRGLLLGRRPQEWEIVTGAPSGELERARGTAPSWFKVTGFEGDLEAELSSRVITVEAMALDPSGKIIDPLGGYQDLLWQRIRGAGDQGRAFRDLPIRMMQVVRLSAQLRYAIDPETFRAIRQASGEIKCAPAGDVRRELNEILTCDWPAQGVEDLRQTGLLSQLIPELIDGVECHQNSTKEYTVWEHTLLTLHLSVPELILRLAALLHDIGKPRCLQAIHENGSEYEMIYPGHAEEGARMAGKILSRLGYDRNTVKWVQGLVSNHTQLVTDPMLDTPDIKALVLRVGPSIVPDLVMLRHADQMAGRPRRSFGGQRMDPLLRDFMSIAQAALKKKVTALALSGKEINQLTGLRPGPEIGRVLYQLAVDAGDDPDINTREGLLARIREFAPGLGDT